VLRPSQFFNEALLVEIMLDMSGCFGGIINLKLVGGSGCGLFPKKYIGVCRKGKEEMRQKLQSKKVSIKFCYINIKISGVFYSEQCYKERMLQRTILSIKSGSYNERSYNERMLQRTVFINKIRKLQRRS
jgi:hypothetical protein